MAISDSESLSEALICHLGLPIILWYFSHLKGKKRLTLSQNPHFYEGLPESPTEYEPHFYTRPTNCQESKGTIYILTNNERRVILELEQKRRTFDNVWRMKNTNTLLFKGSSPAFLFLP
jgi:hypothetical protein